MPADEFTCPVTELAIAPRIFAFALNDLGDSTFEVWPVRAQWTDPIESWATPGLPRSPISDSAGRTQTSDTATVFEGGLSGVPIYHRLDSGGLLERVGAGERLVNPQVFDNILFFSRLGATDWTAVTVLPGETASTELVAPAGVGANTPVTDGTDLAWVQLYEQESAFSYGRTELWTSPYATDPSALEPRRLSVFPTAFTNNRIGVGFGRVWAFELDAPGGASYVRVYSLAGDPTLQWPLPADRKFLRPAIVTPTEIGFYIERTVMAWARVEAIRFYQYDSLALAP
jgi:hypothetical protein